MKLGKIHAGLLSLSLACSASVGAAESTATATTTDSAAADSAAADSAAADSAAADGAALYKAKTCIACHGPDGGKPLMPNFPKLAGQNADYAIAQMNDIKSGKRNNGQTAAMKGVMHLVNDEEIKAIATWLSGLK